MFLYVSSNIFFFLSSQDSMGPLLSAIASGSEERINAWATSSEQWATLEQLITSAGAPGALGGSHSVNGSSEMEMGGGEEWICSHCTLLNLPHLNVCDACTLPR